MYITINQIPACAAPETLGLPTSCAHVDRRAAERDVQLILERHPDAVVEIVNGHCPRPLLRDREDDQ